jgi:hippurate hydrolase
MLIVDRIASYHPEMTAWRRDFHAHPEIGFEEVRTSAIVAEKLRSWGIEVQTGFGKTGLIGVIQGRPGNRKIGLRADMDALPMQEQNDFAHRSTIPNRMHACGHDGHTTMLLGAARYLAETRNFAGTVHLIFQPAEEGLTGAAAMLHDGLFEKFPCDEVYGIHNHWGLPLGTAAIRPGTVLAAVDYFNLTLKGRSSHAAEPHLGLDPLPCAVQIYTALQNLVSRRMNPHDVVVLSIGQFNAGTSQIVIPETVEIAGTIRTLKRSTRQQMDELFHQTVQNLAAAHGVELTLDYRRSYPPTINTVQESSAFEAAARTVVGDDLIKSDRPSLTAGEDFAYYLEKTPGAFLLLGQAAPGHPTAPVHNGHYDFNDDLLPIGASCFARLVEQQLGAEQ